MDEPGLASVTRLPARRAADAVSSVTVRVHQSGHWTVVEVDGEMDIQVVAFVGDVVTVDVTHLVFDLSAVTFLDATGLGLLLSIQRQARDAGGSLRLVAPSRRVRKLLMMTGCDRAFPTFDSIADAVSAPLT